MFYWDWTMIFVIPGLLLGMWAQHKVSSTFKKYSGVRARSCESAQEVARALLNQSGCGSVSINQTSARSRITMTREAIRCV